MSWINLDSWSYPKPTNTFFNTSPSTWLILNNTLINWSWCKTPFGETSNLSNVSKNNAKRLVLKNCRLNNFQRSCKHCNDANTFCVICGSIIWTNACPYAFKMANNWWACSGWSSIGIGWSLAPGEKPRNTCDL